MFKFLERLRRQRLSNKRLPDRRRWGRAKSYRKSWGKRSEVAAALVPDGARVLEIGVGIGHFRDQVKGRCSYLGADLNPLEAETLRLDLDSDALPVGPFDYLVALGVLEYLHRPGEAIAKIAVACDNAVISYCCLRDRALNDEIKADRRERGWVSDLTPADLERHFADHGHFVRTVEDISSPEQPYWELLFQFCRRAMPE